MVSVKKERYLVPREPIIKDLLREVRESLSIKEVLIRSWLGEEERKVREREVRPAKGSVWEEQRGIC